MRSIQIDKKKGMSIGDMYPAVLTIVLVGIVLGVGLYVLSTFHTSISTDYAGAQVGLNATGGTTTLDNNSLAEVVITGLVVVNGTDGNASTNFTYTDTGVITWGSLLITGGDTYLLNVTYDYTYDATDSPEESITTTITGLATFADWIAIIVVVIAAAIVLGVVLSSFGSRGTGI